MNHALATPFRKAQTALDKLSHGSVVLDRYGDAWQLGEPYWYRALGDDSMISSFELAQRGPVKAIYSAPPRAGLPVINAGFPKP